MFAVAHPAAAQHDGVAIDKPFAGTRSPELNLHGGFSHRGLGPAAGLRLAIPILHNGFVSSIDNAVYITFGGDMLFEGCYGGCGRKADKYGVAFAIPITLRWQFNFNPSWSAYAEVGPNVYLHSNWFGKGNRFPGVGRTFDGWFVAAVGGKWHFAQHTSLTLSIGPPYIHVGLDIDL